MKKKLLLTFFSVIATIIALAIVYDSVITGKNPKPVAIEKKEAVAEDGVETVGTPTDDDPWSEMDKLVAAYYEGKEGMFFRGTIKLIDGNEDEDKILEEKKFEYNIVGNCYYYRIGLMEFINKDDYVVIIDHSDKIIGLTQKASVEKNNMFDIGEFRKMMLEQKADAKVAQLGDEKVLTIDNINHPDIQGYRIYYSPQTYRISKILVGMQRAYSLEDGTEYTGEDNSSKLPDQKEQEMAVDSTGNDMVVEPYYYYLEITYNEIRKTSLNKKTFNPESKYIKFNNGTIELTPEYKEYQLLNQIDQ